MSSLKRTAMQVQTTFNWAFGSAEESSTKDLTQVQDTRTLIRGIENTRGGETRPANPRLSEWAPKGGAQAEKINGSKEARTGRATPQQGTQPRADPPGPTLRGRRSRSRNNPWAPGPSWPSFCPLFTPHGLGPDTWDWQEASGRALPAGAG